MMHPSTNSLAIVLSQSLLGQRCRKTLVLTLKGNANLHPLDSTVVLCYIKLQCIKAAYWSSSPQTL